MRDIQNRFDQAIALAPVAIASDTTTVGLTIDLALKETCKFIFASGVLTDGSYTVTLYEGDASDMSDEAAVAAADIVGDAVSFALADDATAKAISYIGHKRYVRAKIVSADTTTGGLLSAVAVLEERHMA